MDSKQRQRGSHYSETDDETLADSILDSMHSCESEATLHGGGSSSHGAGAGGGDTDVEDDMVFEGGGAADPVQGYMTKMRQDREATPTGASGGRGERASERASNQEKENQ